MTELVEITCPACGFVGPVRACESNGWCACGMDYEIQRTDEPGGDLRGLLRIVFTPDEKYPASGSTSYAGPLTGPYAVVT